MPRLDARVGSARSWPASSATRAAFVVRNSSPLARPSEQRPRRKRPVCDSSHRRDFLRRAGRDDQPAARAGLRAEIDDVVRALDHLEIVLDDEQAVPLLDQPVEDAHEQRDVVEMQAGRRLVEDEQRVRLALIDEPLDELEPLGFAAGSTFSGWPSVR